MEQTKHIHTVHSYIINYYSVEKAMRNSWPLVDEELFQLVDVLKKSLISPNLLITDE